MRCVNLVSRSFRQFYIDLVFYEIAMAKTTRRRDIRKIFNSSYLGLKHIQVSLCNLTVAQTRERLLDKARTTISANSRLRIDSSASLLDELDLLSFESACQEYAVKVQTIALSPDQKSSKVQFRETLLSRNGLPEIIANNKGKRSVYYLFNIIFCLYEIKFQMSNSFIIIQTIFNFQLF